MAIQEDPPAGVPDWIVSFGDMMSLLLCFFVLLFSMGQTESQKFQAMADAMHQQFGTREPRLKLYPRTHPTIKNRQERMGREDVDRSQDFQTSETEYKRDMPERERLWMNRPGFTPSLGTILVFAETSSALTEEHQRLLHEVALLFGGKANKIELRGHATGRPPAAGDAYRDDWDISFARCYAAMQYLVEQEGIDRQRIRITVAGKNEPLYTGTIPELLAHNSRVDVFMLGEIASAAAAAGGESK
jgi:chemotaxis protein MotB